MNVHMIMAGRFPGLIYPFDECVSSKVWIIIKVMDSSPCLQMQLIQPRVSSVLKYAAVYHLMHDGVVYECVALACRTRRMIGGMRRLLTAHALIPYKLGINALNDYMADKCDSLRFAIGVLPPTKSQIMLSVWREAKTKLEEDRGHELSPGMLSNVIRSRSRDMRHIEAVCSLLYEPKRVKPTI